MNKLALGNKPIYLEQGMALCNFCGEDKIDCIYGSVKTEVRAVDASEMKFENIAILSVARHFKPTFLMKWMYKVPQKDAQWAHVLPENLTYETKTDTADICHDCIRELATLIKNK